ncbi:MAG: hypothetical protein A2015_04070 [Spirochaetes bacterium GWF1_31_7]|nr:MAG: hypothetical protein A2Y30_14685 [Spirochaetes bacterium GWE1_32_154]OHD48668.1 MAG: hypothetical protein A2015_04070 [Spirochaetes bacterium GWF1_31_7]OHD50201.1 MAG: hypothetical protein A2Y29_12730 [Spirochaetes bacterium GWE2_31_10]OHD82405.1 MAG: hypothetical protein A2355_01080 [Spirochaetes bacterium RIFOXYB1_FULL_32_8]HBD94018.1 hypothetical protein [Spirochaetia bacterium]
MRIYRFILFVIINISSTLHGFDKFSFIKDQSIYIESTISTSLIINGENHGVSENIERTIQKINELTKEGAFIQGVTYSLQKTGLATNKFFKVDDKYDYTFIKTQSGKETFKTGRFGLRDFPILPSKDLLIGESYQAGASYLLTMFNKKIPDLLLDINFVYRYLGDEIVNDTKYSIYSARGIINQEKGKALFQSYQILKILGFSDTIFKFNQTEGIVSSIEEIFDWCLILNDFTVIELSGRTMTAAKTPPPLPVNNMIKIIENKQFSDITLNKDLLLSINIENIQFAPDSPVLMDSEISRIESVIEILKSAGVSKFIIVGHTANVGDPGIQLKLSEQRAQSVFNFIMKKYTFDINNISFTGKGGTQPIKSNETEEEKAKNRRVEFIILPN